MSIQSTGLGQDETPRSSSRVYSIEEAARMLNISRGVAYKAARSGELPGVIRLGKRLVVSKVIFDQAVPSDAA